MTPWRATVLALMILSACRRSSERAAEKIVEKAIEWQGREAEVAIDREQGSITVTLGRAIAPRGWPQAVPIYSHAKRAKIDSSGGGARRLWVATDDSLDEIAAFYRQELAKSGWQIQESEAGPRDWGARRGSESLRLHFVRREGHGESRAEIEYKVGS